MNMNSLRKAASGAIGRAKSVIKSTVNKGKAIVKNAEKRLASAIKGSTANKKNCINTLKKSSGNPVKKAIQIGKNVALNMAVKTGKTKSNAGKSASKRAEDAVKKVNSIVASAVRGSMVTATKTLAKSSGNSKLRSAVIGATGTTMCSDAIISKGKKQTNGEINVANLPVYIRAGNYIEGQKVKVKGVDGKWYVGTVKEDGYIGTGGARQFKFIPDNSAAYSKGNSIENCRSYKYAQEWKDFAKGVWNGMGERSEKMLNSPNDFMNYLTMGVWNSNAENGKKMLKTKNAYDIINWATMGGADMVNGAVNPEKPLSPEHWMNSFGVVSTVFGAKGMQNKYTHNDIIDIKKPYKKAVNDNKIEGGSETKGVSNPKNINVEEVTPPGSQNPVKVYTDGYAQVNKGKIEIYIRGKIKKPSNYNELKDRVAELTKIKNKNPSEFTKEMKKELKKSESIVHNYDRSQGMGKLLDDVGITDTAENNEMIAKTVLDSAKEATLKNTKIRSTINIGNKPVIIESWWIIDKNGTPYCSTIILIEVK